MAYSVTENSASISTGEYSLVSSTTSGVPLSATTECYMSIFLDLNAMASGDSYELKIYEKTISGGTQRIAAKYYFTGLQGEPITILPPIHLKNGYDITLKKLAGTDRTIAWSLRKVT